MTRDPDKVPFPMAGGTLEIDLLPDGERQPDPRLGTQPGRPFPTGGMETTVSSTTFDFHPASLPPYVPPPPVVHHMVPPGSGSERFSSVPPSVHAGPPPLASTELGVFLEPTPRLRLRRTPEGGAVFEQLWRVQRCAPFGPVGPTHGEWRPVPMVELDAPLTETL